MRFSARALSLLLALSMVSAPVLAQYRHSSSYSRHIHSHGFERSSWHERSSYGHRSYGHSRSRDNSGLWIGGAVALAATVGLLAANANRSNPSYVEPTVGYSTPVYVSPGYAAPAYAAPVYAAPVYAVPQPQYVPEQYVPMSNADKAQVKATTDCRRWAMNQSGFDPATISTWTTQVMVDSYNSALDTCMNSRGYRASN